MSAVSTEASPPEPTPSPIPATDQPNPEKPLVIRVGHSGAAVYLLRTVQQHHVHLSSMADTKANILIGASAVIFSLLIGFLQKDGFSLPAVVMLVFTLAAATTAIMAVTPSVKGPPPGSRVFNPLFFGCFSQLTPDEYCRKMEQVLNNDSNIYTSMAMDIYALGGVLYRKKYRYLTYSYRIFLSGLIAAFLSAVVSLWL
jgi:hypothetical protein